MGDPVKDFANHFRAGEPILRKLLNASTVAEADQAVRDEMEWARVLKKDKARPMGAAVFAVLEYLHDIKPEVRRVVREEAIKGMMANPLSFTCVNH